MSFLFKLCYMLLVMLAESQGFVLCHRSRLDPSSQCAPRSSRLQTSSPQKPLYDVTNYTFPDTTTPDGIAQVLEVCFVHGVMQLREGYVDVLKMFIASCMSSYQFGFTIGEIREALLKCPNETANRPLLPEEVDLRHTWYSLVYLTLLAMDHFTIKKHAIVDSIPTNIRETYGMVIDKMVAMQKHDTTSTISVEDLMKHVSIDKLGPTERALFIQSLRVATLTTVVVREAEEATPDGQSLPPLPPIEGAFK
jgi:hypothetical protein